MTLSGLRARSTGLVETSLAFPAVGLLVPSTCWRTHHCFRGSKTHRHLAECRQASSIIKRTIRTQAQTSTFITSSLARIDHGRKILILLSTTGTALSKEAMAPCRSPFLSTDRLNQTAEDSSIGPPTSCLSGGITPLAARLRGLMRFICSSHGFPVSASSGLSQARLHLLTPTAPVIPTWTDNGKRGGNGFLTSTEMCTVS